MHYFLGAEISEMNISSQETDSQVSGASGAKATDVMPSIVAEVPGLTKKANTTAKEAQSKASSTTQTPALTSSSFTPNMVQMEEFHETDICSGM